MDIKKYKELKERTYDAHHEANQSYQSDMITLSKIKTGWLVKSKQGWFAFPTVTEACNHIQKIAND